MSVEGITEADIANYLANTPGFFERHAELLGSIQLTSPHGGRAVSLQERQMEMLREKIKGLEGKIIEMIRHGQENVAIADRLHRWTRAALLTAEPARLPAVLLGELQREFLIPQAGLRLWGVDARHAGEAFAAPVSDDARSFAASLTLPYCGMNGGFEAAGWLEDAATVASLAMIPLRRHPDPDAADAPDAPAPATPAVFGLLVLGSPDPTRYAADMGLDFLQRIGDIASASLVRLLPAA
ncbi:DUF484 family protein [Piscinibacter sakaiensis]|uniref:DUF484 family protein n=1 Tax=Piscinibacter sakaiensis TaxID=1547922 RepID=A0A0K8P7F0_PISS1|nr:DUF484 family protein [Piscinibacter sakaiensis]GAP38583.1 DUF484 family protein [Piscinibacter sakaiensis]